MAASRAIFVHLARRRHPPLRDVALLVVGGRRESRGVVQSAAYGARKFGIRAGSTSPNHGTRIGSRPKWPMSA